MKMKEIISIYQKERFPGKDMFLFILILILTSCGHKVFSQVKLSDTLKIKSTLDFEINGSGCSEKWNKVEWLVIPQRISSGKALYTKMKILHSSEGLYFLFSCEDKKLTATMNADFMDIWNEDVVEIFLLPNEQYPVYFEYEISPFNYELPILISNEQGDLVRWMPFHYDYDRKTHHFTTIQGGEKKSNAMISGWIAEFFIPYKLLRPLINSLPKPGSVWRANFCRIDYDDSVSKWSWQLTNKTFHEFKKFGFLMFE